MDAYGTSRLAAKDAESAIVARICEDFNLTPVLARAHYEQMARYFAEFGHMALRPGELCYVALAAGEPPGKPIMACRKVQVALELANARTGTCFVTGAWRRCAKADLLAWPARPRCRADCSQLRISPI